MCYEGENGVNIQFVTYLLRSLEREKARFAKKYNQVSRIETPVSQLASGLPVERSIIYIIDFEENLPIEEKIDNPVLVKSIKKLSGKETEILFLKIISDMTFDGISMQTGKSTSEVKRIYYNMLAKLRKSLEEDL